MNKKRKRKFVHKNWVKTDEVCPNLHKYSTANVNYSLVFLWYSGKVVVSDFMNNSVNVANTCAKFHLTIHFDGCHKLPRLCHVQFEFT